MAKKSKALDDIITEAYKRFQLAVEAESDNHKRAEEAILFRDLEQWPQKIRNARENDPEGARPCLVVDKLNQYINQVKNDQRQNRPGIKVRGVDSRSDPEVAEIYQGIIRHIEDCSRASIAYDTAHEHATDGGFGYWRIVTEYVDDDSLDQEPRIVRVRNRFSVLLDPSHQQPDGSDAKWGFVFERIPRDEFKAQYPGKNECSWDQYSDLAGEWVGKDDLIVAEYFRIVEQRSELVVSGRTRQVVKKIVEWRKLTAAEELDFKIFPGQYIPIVQVIGNEIDFKGKRRLSGLIRGAMDAQRIYNYSASSFVEMVALAPRAPWTAAEGQIEGREADWKSANRRNISVLQYKPVLEGDQLVPPPQRQPMPGIPAGWQQVMVNAEHDVQASMGMYASNLGQQTQATSGKQELALQRRGDISTFHYADNLALAIQHTGRILIDIIPMLYDTERIARILGEDGSEDYVRLNPDQDEAVKTIRGADGKTVKYYNLNIGKYDVTATVGPAFATKRMEAAEWMTQMVSAKPELIQVMGDIMFRNMDVPGADEIAKRLKKLLPPQLQESTETEDLPPEVSQAIEQARMAMEQQKQALLLASQELEKLKTEANAEIQKAKDAKAQLDRQALEIRHAKDMLSAAERVFEAKMAAQDAEQGAMIKDAVTTVKELIAGHEAQLASMLQGRSQEGEQAQQQAQIAAQIMASHQELLAAINEVLSAMMAPRTRTAQVISPSGQRYELTSTEAIGV